MAYKNLKKNYNPGSDLGIKTNLPIEPIQSIDNSKKTMRIFGDYFNNAVTIHSEEYDAVIITSDDQIYEDDETYIAVNYDWSNLNEKIDYVLSDFNNLNQKINTNIRNMFLEKYTYENLCMYWYEIFSNLNEVSKYE